MCLDRDEKPRRLGRKLERIEKKEIATRKPRVFSEEDRVNECQMLLEVKARWE